MGWFVYSHRRTTRMALYEMPFFTITSSYKTQSIRSCDYVMKCWYFIELLYVHMCSINNSRQQNFIDNFSERCPSELWHLHHNDYRCLNRYHKLNEKIHIVCKRKGIFKRNTGRNKVSMKARMGASSSSSFRMLGKVVFKIYREYWNCETLCLESSSHLRFLALELKTYTWEPRHANRYASSPTDAVMKCPGYLSGMTVLKSQCLHCGALCICQQKSILWTRRPELVVILAIQVENRCNPSEPDVHQRSSQCRPHTGNIFF